MVFEATLLGLHDRVGFSLLALPFGARHQVFVAAPEGRRWRRLSSGVGCQHQTHFHQIIAVPPLSKLRPSNRYRLPFGVVTRGSSARPLRRLPSFPPLLPEGLDWSYVPAHAEKRPQKTRKSEVRRS
ncbi:uncharacterized protein A4U43_C09F5070 [Asparagus officinalis]|uniref:Uncharacterized protein n=1 Tax=Asparagus officinalis TaxID=4686 RepID=A0A5P1E5E9_ASPOF|nr:uncharacterized protein A4U43_C09F5070 [Asparagus officinalis]